MAPEVLRHDASCKCDIWSLGCLLFAILNPVPTYLPDGNGGHVLYNYPFLPQRHDSDPYGVQSMLDAQMRGPRMSALSTCSQEARYLVLKMLTFDDRHRPSAEDVLRMNWFRQASDSHCVPLSKDMISALTQEREVKVWWRAMATAAASEIPAAKIGHLVDLFHNIDKDSSGVLDTEEMITALVAAGVEVTTARAAAEAADFDGSGQIEWSEFVAALLPSSAEMFSTGLLVAFSHFDTDHNGFLDRNEIEQMLQSGRISSDNMPLAKSIDDMVEELDRNNDGQVSWEEFYSYFISEMASSD
jgi:Ca2+-binding EF-hand superfamily protein